MGNAPYTTQKKSGLRRCQLLRLCMAHFLLYRNVWQCLACRHWALMHNEGIPVLSDRFHLLLVVLHISCLSRCLRAVMFLHT